MQRTNDVTLTGTFKTEAVSNTFSKQTIAFDSKNRDGQWETGGFEIYVKQDLMSTSGMAEGDTIKIKGFMVFSFFTKQDGTKMSFPKMIVTEVLELEKAGAQPQAAQAGQPIQPTQPQAMMNPGVAVQPPVPGAAPMAPPQPSMDPNQAFPPQMPPAPQPMAQPAA